MKTIVIGSEKADKEVKNSTLDKSALRPSVSPNEKAKEDKEADKPTTAGQVNTKAEQPKTEDSKPKSEQPKAEPTKTEIKEQLQEQKPVMNLDSTIKLALELNRRIVQRGRLLETIGTLEAFEVAQKDDADETENNHFQHCELTISDDKGREFTTKNPFIINAVAKMVDNLCVGKLAEIEGEIQFPNN